MDPKICNETNLYALGLCDSLSLSLSLSLSVNLKVFWLMRVRDTHRETERQPLL